MGDLAIRDQLPGALLHLIDDLALHWKTVIERIVACDAAIASTASKDIRCVRARQVIGVGALTADALVATVGDAREFKNGRQMAAWLGLAPTQHSSGGKSRLGTISCRGDSYLRTLLIQGARSSLQRAKAVAIEKATPEQLWIRDLVARLPFGKVLVAIANKHARQLWAMLAREEDYDAHAWLKHPMVQRPRSTRPFQTA
ncbi:MAG: Transposase IS116/IS110/IS902 family protein [Alphaproteobacteria bacterium ADurb.BinA280]|nr:MAG: Transposase IS116/IS110/IS902 family protein [Alphaproteobacteria bacterium ADurb.BinA280]